MVHLSGRESATYFSDQASRIVAASALIDAKVVDVRIAGIQADRSTPKIAAEVGRSSAEGVAAHKEHAVVVS